MQKFCYSARLCGQDSTLVSSGTVAADSMDDAFTQLLKRYPVKVRPSGSLCQVHKDGREISIRILRPLESTPEGKAALRAYNEECARKRREEEAVEESLRAQLEAKIEAAGGLAAFLKTT